MHTLDYDVRKTFLNIPFKNLNSHPSINKAQARVLIERALI